MRVVREGQCLSVLIPMAGSVGDRGGKSCQDCSVKRDRVVCLGMLGRFEGTINTLMTADGLEELTCELLAVVGLEAPR